MNEVIVQTPSSAERSESELNSQRPGWRRLVLIDAVFQSVRLSWWFAKRSRPRSKSDLSRSPDLSGCVKLVVIIPILSDARDSEDQTAQDVASAAKSSLPIGGTTFRRSLSSTA